MTVFQTQQLGPRILQKKNASHGPFHLSTASLIHWTFRSIGPCSSLPAIPRANGAVKCYNSPADLQLQTGVTESQFRHWAILEGGEKSLVGVPFLEALRATELFMVFPCNSTICWCTSKHKAAVLRTVPFCAVFGGKARCIAELCLCCSNRINK